jgi:hypothetical protein
MRFNEFVVHSCDLARATGLDHELLQLILSAMPASALLALAGSRASNRS